LRDDIQNKQEQARATLNEIMLHEFGGSAKTGGLEIKFEEATWDSAKNKEGKPKKCALKISDIKALQPFHWGYEFDQIINERGGFDVILANPPWEIFKPNSKEFFEQHSDLITKKKMTIHEFEKEQAKLLKDKDIREAWLEYLSGYPHQSAFFRSAPQYRNQISVVNGKKAGSDINLYKLFTEQCFNLLRPGGQCGIVIPSGIYTDLGSKQLREMLFTQSKITGLFGFENRKEIFEGVHRSYKFIVFTFEKGNKTEFFPAAFMRLDVEELARFPQQGSIEIPVELINRISPDSLSVMEFKSALDIQIAEKMLRFPQLGKKLDGIWTFALTREFDMTNDSELFKSQPGVGRLPLYEGKLIHQFTHQWDDCLRYWVVEKDARKALTRKKDSGQKLDYQKYRLGIRAIGRTTDKRTLIVGPIPKNVFCGNSILVCNRESQEGREISDSDLIALQALMNSFVVDFYIRQMVSANLNMFYIYQIPVPRLVLNDKFFKPIIGRAARLICTTREFDDLGREVGLGDHRNGATDTATRAKLRAELDGIIAQLYGFTEEEFNHILHTFPLVEKEIKDAALAAYKELAPKPADQEVAVLVAKGENAELEFKSSARWDMRQNKPNKDMEQIVVKTVAAFLNSETGGTLLIGVEDGGAIIGLEHDFNTLGKRQDPDGYENFLTSLLLGNFGKDSSPLIHISFHQIDGKDICRIIAKPSPKPVFVKDDKGEHLFIRAGNSTRLLSTKEAIDYCKIRWKS
jgi:Putative DNA-binding domain